VQKVFCRLQRQNILLIGTSFSRFREAKSRKRGASQNIIWREAPKKHFLHNLILFAQPHIQNTIWQMPQGGKIP
jgi:hypothetical protein